MKLRRTSALVQWPTTAYGRGRCTVLIAALLGTTVPRNAGAIDVWKQNSVTSSTFLLGNGNAAHTQCLYLPGDLSNLHSGWVYAIQFVRGQTGQDIGNTLTNLTIGMGQTIDTAFPNGNTFFTGLQTVFFNPLVGIPPGNELAWMGLLLDTEFPYDSTRTLIIDVSFTASATQSFATMGSANNGRKIYNSLLTAPTGFTNSTTWQDFGMNLEPFTGIAEEHLIEAMLAPVPTTDALYVQLAMEHRNALDLELYDGAGRIVHRQVLAAGTLRVELFLDDLPAGAYTLLLRDAKGIRARRRAIVIE